MSGKVNAAFKGPVQLLSRDEEDKLMLNTDQLEEMLKDEEVKDRQLVVLSVVGAFRRGKSFLLNFMIRYLRCNGGDDWIEEGGAVALEGFTWRGGIERDTTGILVWPEVFLMGKDKALILMDTQGTFDSKTSFKDNAIIFALSTLISSVQIFNLFERIQMDDISNLQYFCEFGKMVQQSCQSKPFQKLIFLIRDWKFPKNSPYGFKGGEMQLHTWIQNPDANKEQAEMIQTCFSDISCFLLPYPGDNVNKEEDFKGDVEEIDGNFLKHLEIFIESVLGGSLAVKTVGGKLLVPTDLVLYMQKWIVALQDDKIKPKTLFQSMAEVGHQKAARASLEQYEGKMQTKCGGVDSVTDLPALHEEAKTAALQTFDEFDMFGGKNLAKPVRESLIQDLEARYVEYTRNNDAKKEQERKLAMKEELRTAREAALKIYSAGMEVCSGVTSVAELPALHAASLNAALAKFTETATKFGQEDMAPYVTEIEKELSDQLAVFTRRNNEKLERERKEGVRKELRDEKEKAAKMYQQYMDQQLGGRKTTANFNLVHETNSKRALDSFKERTSHLDQKIVEEFCKRLSRELHDNSLLLKMSNDEKLSKEEDKQIQASLRTAKEDALGIYERQMETQTGSSKPVADLPMIHKAATEKAISDFKVTANKFKEQSAPILKDVKKDIETRFETYKRKNADLEAQKKAEEARENLRELTEVLVRDSKSKLRKTCDAGLVSDLDIFLSNEQTSTLTKFDLEAKEHVDNKAVKKIRQDLVERLETLCDLYRHSQQEKHKEVNQKGSREVRAAASEAISSYQSTMTAKCGGRKSVKNLSQVHSTTKSDVIATFDLVAENHPGLGVLIEHQKRMLEQKIESHFSSLEVTNNEKLDIEREVELENILQGNADYALKNFSQKIKRASESNSSLSGFLKDANKAKDDVLSDFNSSVSSIDPMTVSRFRRQLNTALEDQFNSYHELAKAKDREGSCVIS